MTNFSQPGTALITGASAGIGALYADRLARRGYNLILVARNRTRLETLARDLADQTGRTIEVVVADLSDRSDLARVEAILRTDSSVTMLVNNAGLGGTSPLLESNVDAMTTMVDLNVTALMRLTYAFVPGLVERGGGTIINLASIVAVHPELLNGVYGGTKAFVLAFSQSLHHELSSKNIRVQAVLPGATATEFWPTAGTPLGHLPAEILMSPEDLIDSALAGLDLGELVTLPSLPNIADWDAHEQTRQVLIPQLSRSNPANRYQPDQTSAANFHSRSAN